MAKIWGLDLKDMQWGKFKSSYMWNTEYHLRRTKFIVYQCAMVCTVVSESLGTAALSDYVDQQAFLEHHVPGSSIYNDDFVGIFAYNIFVGIYVATIFGSAFFFDLFWPQRYEAQGVKLAWRICTILSILFTLSAALGCTVIVATHTATVTGPNREEAIRHLAELHPTGPLLYKHNARGIASLCFLWPGFVATVASTVILWHSLAHIDRHGPFSTHVAEHGTAAGPGHEREKVDPIPTRAGIARPAPTASRPGTSASRPGTSASRPGTAASAAAAATAALYPERAAAQPVAPPYDVDARGQPAWPGALSKDAYPNGPA